MPIINLFTDFKNDPLYTGLLRSYLQSHFDGKLVESTHFLPYDNIMTSSFIIKNLYPKLPEGTVHLICTNTSSTKITQHLAFELNGHWFVVADNGLPDLIAAGQKLQVFALPHRQTTFAELDILAPAAVHLAQGKPIDQIAQPTETYKHAIAIEPVVMGNRIQGTVIYIDSYGNAITNISKQLFEQYRQGRKYKVWISLPMHFTTRIGKTYRSSPGDFSAVFNKLDLLELAVNYGNLAQMLNIKENQTEVIVEFE